MPTSQTLTPTEYASLFRSVKAGSGRAWSVVVSWPEVSIWK